MSSLDSVPKDLRGLRACKLCSLVKVIYRARLTLRKWYLLLRPGVLPFEVELLCPFGFPFRRKNSLYTAVVIIARDISR